MLKRVEPGQLNDFFLPLSGRREKGVYFCRIAGYSPEVEAFIKQYYEAARRNGVIIDGRIPNPDTNQLAYFSEMMGAQFQMAPAFLDQRLAKWLPRMSQGQRETVVSAIYSTLQDMQRSGKNENMLRNAYIKYMCWLYYKFERIVNQLGSETLPKILYDGSVSHYELQLLLVLSRAGADIVLLERAGDGPYLQLDSQSAWTTLWQTPDMTPFPEQFNLKWLQQELMKQANRQRLYGTPPAVTNCTNAWMKKPQLGEVLTPFRDRGPDSRFFCNAFLFQHGVEDKLLFSNDLFTFYQQLKSEGRRVCLLNGGIPAPTPEEISAIRRQNYQNVDQLAAGLVPNIQYPESADLQRLMVKAFVDLILEESKSCEGSLSRLTNRAVYLLVWLRRYQKELFGRWKMPEVAVFLLFGKCASANEALFLRFLARLPVDVVLLIPNRNEGCTLSDPTLLTLEFEDSLPMERFPGEPSQVREAIQTAAADREIGVLLITEKLAALCHMFRERAGDLKALAESFRPLLVSADELAYDEKACAKNLTDASKAHLNAVAELFAACDPFDAPSLEAALHGYIEGNGLKFKDVAPALRTALMGFMGGPHLPEIMAFLGKDASLARIRRAAGM